MTLTEQYNKGQPSLPPNGRYEVIMKIQGYRTVLEKKILKGSGNPCGSAFRQGKGSNYLPISGLRYFKIPFMDFKIKLQNSEVFFVYDNNVLVDTLRKVSYKIWLGKVFYRDKFIDWFWLKKK